MVNAPRSFGLILSGILALTLTACAGSAAKPASPTSAATGSTAPEGPRHDYKMSVVTNDQSAWYKGAQKFAELVKERSGGRLTIKVFPNGQLASGNQVQELQMLQNGAIDFTYHSNILYTNIDPAFNVISMPWIFRDEKDADAFMSSDVGKQLLARVEQKGIVGLAYAENGFRQLTNSKVAVALPADMKGRKIRIPGIKMYTSLYKALGANPTTMNFGEVFVALQQGGIDGQENPLDVIVSSKMYEVQKYVSLWDYSYDALILGMNKKAFDALPKADQDVIRQAAVEASKYEIGVNRQGNEANLKSLQDKGMTVVKVTPEAKADFKKLMEPVYAEYEPIIGKDILDKVKAIAK